MTKLLFLAGSARQKSLNKKLAELASELAKKAGAEVSSIDLSDFEMPLYHGDLEQEQGLPENAKKLKRLFVEQDGFFIASPEYNGSFSALLKNTLDWISRSHQDNEPPLSAYKGKVAALASVSPGGLGGLRGLVPLRMLLGNIGVTVIPSQLAIGSGYQAFDAQGGLLDEKQMSSLQNVIDELLTTAAALKSSQ